MDSKNKNKKNPENGEDIEEQKAFSEAESEEEAEAEETQEETEKASEEESEEETEEESEEEAEEESEDEAEEASEEEAGEESEEEAEEESEEEAGEESEEKAEEASEKKAGAEPEKTAGAKQPGPELIFHRPLKVPEQKAPPKFGTGIFVGVLIALAVVMLIAVPVFVLLMRGRVGSGSVTAEEQEKIDTIEKYLDNYYLYDIEEEDYVDGIARGLLSSTEDKYAKYYDKEEFSMLLEESAGVYSGIGVNVIEDEKGQVVVLRTYEGSPAAEAGIREKDVIVEVDGEKDFEDLDALVKKVRGEEGTSVNLVIKRGKEEIPMTLERRNIDMQTVEYEMLDGSIGYIQLLEFDTISVEQFDKAINDLVEQGATSLILDLRDNPGGDYDTVMKMADRVLPEGVIAHVINKNGEVKEERSDEEHKITLPMAVLINENSASASELFSGAIKDYGIATIIGKTSYGKGVIQSIFRLSDGSGMKFTTEEYLTPKKNHINGIGVEPDIEVDIPKSAYKDGILEREEDTQLQKAIEVLEQETLESVRK